MTLTNAGTCPTCGRGPTRPSFPQLQALELRRRKKTVREIAELLDVGESAVTGRFDRARGNVGAPDLLGTITICIEQGWLPIAVADAPTGVA